MTGVSLPSGGEQVTPNEAYLIVGQVPGGVAYAKSEPGMAKTATGAAVAELGNREFLSVELKQWEEEDHGGFPNGGKDEWGNRVMFKDRDYRLVRAENTPSVVFFDEFGSVSESMQAAALGTRSADLGEGLDVRCWQSNRGGCRWGGPDGADG